jgi:hypothetical protein
VLVTAISHSGAAHMPLVDAAQAATQAATDPASGLTEFFLTQGVLGALCIAISYIAWTLWKKLDTERAAFKADLKAKDDRIDALQEERLKEAREGYTFARSIQTTLDAFLAAMRQGSRA